VLNGVVAPTSGDGVDGDFWINTATSEIYGPKTAGVWGSPTSLIGPTGPQGPTGPTGPQGPAGTLGTAVLDDLSDVTITSVTTGQMLKYSGSGQWINTNILDAVDSISSPEFVQFDLAPTAPNNVGKLMWSADDGTFTYLLAGGNIEAFVGQAEYQLVYNNTGSTLTKGQVVYVDGAQGQRIKVALADADTEATSSKTFGVVGESIANAAEGFVVTSGMLRGIDTSAYTDGTPLWLSSTAGNFTSTMPSPPAHGVFVGWVIKSHVSSGEIFVKIQNGFELKEIHDVSITSPANDQGIFYNSTTSLWENKAVPGVVPAGAVMPFAGATEPAGWLLCYGQAVSRTTYSSLFAAVGTLYGVGDGSTTFNLPDLRGRVVAGQDDMGGTSVDFCAGS